jgi:hypothetical protein
VAARLAPLARQPGLVLAGLALILYALALNSLLYGWGDDAHYMIVAHAVSSGDGLRDVMFPAEPHFPYPIPLFPLVLSPLVAVFGLDLTPPKLLVLATGVGAVYATYRLFRTRVEEPIAIAVAAMVAVSPQVVSFTHQVMTEVPYLLVSLLTLMAVERYAAPSARWRSPALALAAGSLIVALLVRSIAIALLAAAVAYLVLEGGGDRRARLTKAAAVAGLCLAAWFAVNYSTLGHIPYGDELRGGASAQQGTDDARLVNRVRSNVDGYVDAIPETISYRLFVRPSGVGGALGLLVIAAGFVAAARRRRTVVEYYFLAYLAVLLAYPPANSGNLRRYLIPLIPFLVFYFALGVRWAVTALRLRRPVVAGGAPGVAVTIAVLALFGAANLFETARASVLRVRPEMFDFRQYTDFDSTWTVARWAGSNTPANSLVSTQDPYGFYFWSQRQVTWHPSVPPGAGGDAVARDLVADDVDYVAVDRSQHRPFAAFLERHPDAFVRVYSSRASALYQVRPPARHTGVAR